METLLCLLPIPFIVMIILVLLGGPVGKDEYGIPLDHDEGRG